MVNHKRVERLYNEEGLWVRKRTRKRMKGAPRQALQPPGDARQDLWIIQQIALRLRDDAEEVRRSLAAAD